MGNSIFATPSELLRRAIKAGNEPGAYNALHRLKQVDIEVDDLHAAWQHGNWPLFLDITTKGRLYERKLPAYMVDKMVATPQAWFALWQFVKTLGLEGGLRLSETQLTIIVETAAELHRHDDETVQNAVRLLHSAFSFYYIEPTEEMMQAALTHEVWPLLTVALKHGWKVPTAFLGTTRCFEDMTNPETWAIVRLLAVSGQLFGYDLLDLAVRSEVALTSGYTTHLHLLENGTPAADDWLPLINLERDDGTFFKLNLYRRLADASARVIWANERPDAPPLSTLELAEQNLCLEEYQTVREMLEYNDFLSNSVPDYWLPLIHPTEAGRQLIQHLQQLKKNPPSPATATAAA